MHRLPLVLCTLALTGSAVLAALYFRVDARKQELELRLVAVTARAARLDHVISDVRSNLTVAQVLPDSLRGVLQKGDPAVLIR